MGLDVADAAVIILKVTLNDKIGVIWSGQIEVIVAGGLVIERDLEVPSPDSPTDTYLAWNFTGCSLLQCVSFDPSRLRLPEGPREGNGFECVSGSANNWIGGHSGNPGPALAPVMLDQTMRLPRSG